jgi:hypothetical protein
LPNVDRYGCEYKTVPLLMIAPRAPAAPIRAASVSERWRTGLVMVLVFLILLGLFAGSRFVLVRVARVFFVVRMSMHMLMLVGVDQVAVAMFVSVLVHVLMLMLVLVGAGVFLVFHDFY